MAIVSQFTSDQETIVSAYASEPVTRKRPVIRELNGVRGAGALIVFFAHALGTFPDAPAWGRVINGFDLFSRSVNSWVDVFFVLSGFFITSILLQRRSSVSYYHDFYWRRGLRILPLYVASLIAVYLLIPHSGPYIFLSAIFLANFTGFLHIPTDGPFWTLALEEQFYLLWPAVIRRRSVRSIGRLALGIAVVSALLRFVDAADRHNNFVLTVFRLDGLAMGAFLACYFEQRQADPQTRLRENLWFSGTLFAGVGLVVLAYLGGSFVDPKYYPRALDLLGMVIFFTGLLGLIIAHTGERGPQAIFRSRVLGFFGLISYAFYMSHMYIILLSDRWRGPITTGDTRAYVVRLLTILMLTTGVSLLSRYVIELPALRLRRYVLTQPAPPPVVTTPLPLA